MASGHRAPRRLAINGFGRIGCLVLRALWGRAGIKIAHINDPSGDAATAAHLLEFDSVHGRWLRAIEANGADASARPLSPPDGFRLDGRWMSCSRCTDPTEVP